MFVNIRASFPKNNYAFVSPFKLSFRITVGTLILSSPIRPWCASLFAGRWSRVRWLAVRATLTLLTPTPSRSQRATRHEEAQFGCLFSCGANGITPRNHSTSRCSPHRVPRPAEHRHNPPPRGAPHTRLNNPRTRRTTTGTTAQSKRCRPWLRTIISSSSSTSRKTTN